ncbi:hypothetical protein D3C76_1055620 [compost metagenome]
MAAGRSDFHQAAAGAEQAFGFVPIQRAEDAGEELTAARRQRYAGHAGDQPGEPGIAFARTLDRFPGNVQGVAVGHRQGVGDLRGVVTLATADVDPALWRVAGSQLRQALGHRRVMAGVEEVAAGFDHRLVIPRVAAVLVLHRQQVQVTLARAVETMPGGAGHAVVHRAQRFAADRTREHQASNLIRVW